MVQIRLLVVFIFAAAITPAVALPVPGRVRRPIIGKDKPKTQPSVHPRPEPSKSNLSPEAKAFSVWRKKATTSKKKGKGKESERNPDGYLTLPR